MIRIVAMVLIASFSGCADQQVNQKLPANKPANPVFEPTPRILANGESSHISVQHILIGFRGSVPGKPITRTKEKAEKLAKDVFEQAKSGQEFEKLVEKYTDDAVPGIYRMANRGEQSLMHGNPDDFVYDRAVMVPAFGDVGFPLQVGEIGMSEFDPVDSPFGWHIIKRLK